MNDIKIKLQSMNIKDLRKIYYLTMKSNILLSKNQIIHRLLEPLHSTRKYSMNANSKLKLQKIKDKLKNKYNNLFDAIYEGKKEIIKNVLDNGVDVNSINAYGYTPLMIASNQGKCDIIKILLEYHVPQLPGEGGTSYPSVTEGASHHYSKHNMFMMNLFLQ